jgi:protein-disulfide isomerase
MPTESDVPLTPAVSKRDHLRGRVAAPMTLVQFGDYACPHCTEAHPVVRQLMDATEGQLRFVYRHYPLVGDLSRRAAEATEAAAQEGAFWKMHDLLSAMGGDLGEPDLYGAAEAAGLDAGALRSQIEQGTHAARVEEDIDSARRSDAGGTPTFFVNGQRYDATLSADDVLDELELTTQRQSVLARAYMQRLEGILGRAGLF